jgi:hypothetical protein
MSPGCEEAYFQAENTGLTLGINGLKTASLTRMFEHHNSSVSTKDCFGVLATLDGAMEPSRPSA